MALLLYRSRILPSIAKKQWRLILKASTQKQTVDWASLVQESCFIHGLFTLTMTMAVGFFAMPVAVGFFAIPVSEWFFDLGIASAFGRFWSSFIYHALNHLNIDTFLINIQHLWHQHPLNLPFPQTDLYILNIHLFLCIILTPIILDIFP